MFGANKILSKVTDRDHLAVEDVFYTIQGEGPLSGMPALFIRLAGCPLRCAFCDTQFSTQEDKPRFWLDIAEKIVMDFTPQQRKLVVITGGEPMRQNWSQLAEFLLRNGTRKIQVETAGVMWQEDLVPLLFDIMFVCSPKTPGVHPSIAAQCNHWKYVVRAGETSEVDGLPIYGTQPNTLRQRQTLFRPTATGGNTIWLSPCDDYDPARNKANLAAVRDLALKHGYRVSLQTHKLLDVK